MKYLVFDIETVPNGEAGWEPPADEPDAFPPPPAWKVVSIGTMLLSLDHNSREKNQVISFGNLGEPDNEPQMLIDFINLCEREKPVLVSYNGRRFDVPVIEQRCMRWGIQARFLFSKDIRYRFQYKHHLDLVEQISNYGATRIGKLHNNCMPLGIPGKFGVDGTLVKGLIEAGKHQEVDSYCLCDVAETAWLLVRYLHLRGSISGTANYNAVHAIRNACIAKSDPMLNMMLEKTNIKRLSLEEQEGAFVDNIIQKEEEEDEDLPF